MEDYGVLDTDPIRGTKSNRYVCEMEFNHVQKIPSPRQFSPDHSLRLLYLLQLSPESERLLQVSSNMSSLIANQISYFSAKAASHEMARSRSKV